MLGGRGEEDDGVRVGERDVAQVREAPPYLCVWS
jgi:hypothetical protein